MYFFLIKSHQPIGNKNIERKIIMKRIFVLLMTFVLCSNCFFVFATESPEYENLKTLGDYGDKEYIYDNFEVNYIFEGKNKVMNKNDFTYKEFEVLLRVLSDEYLLSEDKMPEKPLETTDSIIPQNGYVEFLDENDGNWLVAFDKTRIYARCINSVNKTYKHGFFAYRNNMNPDAFMAFFNNIAKGEAEEPKVDDEFNEEDSKQKEPKQEEIKNNLIEVSNIKEMYSAHFPLDAFSYDFAWGICSYRRANTSKDATVAYITFGGMEFIKLITEGGIKNNTITFDDKRMVYTENSKSEEFDNNFTLTHDFELQVDVDENMQVKNARITYAHRTTGVTKTVDVDMSVYKQNGHLPSVGEVAFSADNNKLADYETKEETKEKEESKIYTQTFVGDINKFILREKFYFTFTADKSFEGILTEEVAKIGEDVSAEVRIYIKDMDSKRNGEVKFYNVTILEGSKGKLQLWGGFDYNLDYFPLYKPTDMVMHAITSNRYITGSAYEPLVRYTGEGVYNHRFMIKPEFEGTKIKGIKIKYVPEENGVYNTNATIDNAVSGENVRYELLVPLTEMTKKEEKAEKELENRNPERYVTTVRGRVGVGDYRDYRINSLYQVSFGNSQKIMPDWYNDLGDDVKMYLISFTQVWNKEDRDNYTMIKFEGSRDSIWFINGNAEFGESQSGNKYIVSEYNSLISFDGFERVRNTVDYETITLSADFNHNEKMAVENITVNMGSGEIEFDENEIIYIGGGKITYESFF